jgi:hypothetical protein
MEMKNNNKKKTEKKEKQKKKTFDGINFNSNNSIIQLFTPFLYSFEGA